MIFDFMPWLVAYKSRAIAFGMHHVVCKSIPHDHVSSFLVM